MKKIVSVLLLISVFLASIFVEFPVSATVTEKSQEQIATISDYIALGTDREALTNGFKPIVRNNKLVLFYKNETAEVALYSIENDIILYSNPQKIPDTIKGEAALRIASQLYISYYTNNSQINYYSSAYDSLKNNQVKASIREGKTLSVNYYFGKIKITEDMLPIAIPKEKFEKKVLNGLSDKDIKTIKDQYTLISVNDDISDEKRAEYAKKYANFEKNDIYILNTYIPQYEIKPLYEALFQNYTTDDFNADNKAAGINIKSENASVNFDLTLRKGKHYLSITILVKSKSPRICYP